LNKRGGKRGEQSYRSLTSPRKRSSIKERLISRRKTGGRAVIREKTGKKTRVRGCKTHHYKIKRNTTR